MSKFEVLPSFSRLTEEQWQAIRAVRADWHDAIDWPEVRKAIEQAGREFSEVDAQREQFARADDYKEALVRTRLHLRRLQAAMRTIEEHSASDLAGLPDPALSHLEKRLDQLDQAYSVWTAPFGGRQNPLKDTLHERLFSIWEKQLHGRIGSSKNKFDEPIGPLIRFLNITITAITGNAPGHHGLRDLINKAKKLRRRRASKRSPTSRSRRRNRQKN